MNQIFLVGRLTSDPEVRFSPQGKAVCTFTLAVDRPYRKDHEKEADFIKHVVWDKRGESCGNNLRKGSEVATVGRLQIRSYDGKDGQKRWVTEVIVSEIQFLNNYGKKDSNQQKDDTGEINLDDLDL
jgi:single-strand DNA-binding protein